MLVQRIREPAAFRLVLIQHQPRETTLQLGLLARHAGLLQHETDDTCGVTVALGLKGCIVSPLPPSDERRQAETAVRLLLAERFLNDGFLLRARQQPGYFGRRP